MKNFSVLLVCMGNICRSPTAHGVFKRKLLDAGIAASRFGMDGLDVHQQCVVALMAGAGQRWPNE